MCWLTLTGIVCHAELSPLRWSVEHGAAFFGPRRRGRIGKTAIAVVTIIAPRAESIARRSEIAHSTPRQMSGPRGEAVRINARQDSALPPREQQKRSSTLRFPTTTCAWPSVEMFEVPPR